MVYTFFDKKTESGTKAIANEVLPKEFHKPVIKKVKVRKIYPTIVAFVTRWPRKEDVSGVWGFKDNIWAANLADMGSVSSKNRDVKYLLCVKDVFTKYTWIKRLKVKKAKTAFNVLLKQ